MDANARELIFEDQVFRIIGAEETHRLNYLKATSFPMGLIVNFGSKKL